MRPLTTLDARYISEYVCSMMMTQILKDKKLMNSFYPMYPFANIHTKTEKRGDKGNDNEEVTLLLRLFHIFKRQVHSQPAILSNLMGPYSEDSKCQIALFPNIGTPNGHVAMLRCMKKLTCSQDLPGLAIVHLSLDGLAESTGEVNASKGVMY